MDEENIECFMELLKQNAQTLAKELDWFIAVVDVRIQLYFKQETHYHSIEELSPPELSTDVSPYAQLARNYSFAERLTLILALTPHIKPSVLDIFYTKNENYGRGYTEFGGINGDLHSGFLPTGETLSFILAGEDLAKRFELRTLLSHTHFFYQQNILSLEAKQNKHIEPLWSNPLSISEEYLSLLTLGTEYKATYSSSFPAKPISTSLEWNDLIVEDYLKEELEDITIWIKHNKTLMKDWGLSKHLKRGYRALFYGPPGTGKTLTASLIGKKLGLEVYRVDLSLIVSKYIGETQKNLSKVFDQAESKQWVLFFDEADALFGKRTATSSSNDRNANQEIAYLLQRIEDYDGIILLASNLKGNLDDAFTRRFQSMLHFPLPNEQQRHQLWEQAFKAPIQLEEKIDFHEIAQQYKISGGAISNVLRYCAIKAIEKNTKTVSLKDIENGIRKEYQKEGKDF